MQGDLWGGECFCKTRGVWSRKSEIEDGTIERRVSENNDQWDLM